MHFHGIVPKADQPERRNPFRPPFLLFFFPFSSFLLFTQQGLSEYLHAPGIALAIADMVVNMPLKNINHMIPHLIISLHL